MLPSLNSEAFYVTIIANLRQLGMIFFCSFALFSFLCNPKKLKGTEGMNYLDKYRIPFGSLAKGEHEFEFEIDDKFFEQFGNVPVQHGFLDVLVTVNKQETMLLLDFTMEGSIETLCDRCGDPMELELTGFNELTVKFGPEPKEESEDVIVISPKEHELNVAQFIYEYVTLLIPMRNVHEEDENGESSCNPETLMKLDQLRHREKEEEEKENDPRWDVLKKINLN